MRTSVGELDFAVFADSEHPNDWRMEVIDRKSGDVMVNLFSGPGAQKRAHNYFHDQVETALRMHSRREFLRLTQENRKLRGVLKEALHDLDTTEGLWATDKDVPNEYWAPEADVLWQITHPSRKKIAEVLK